MREARGTVLLAVADGVGGGPGGEIAAEAAVQELAIRFFMPSAGTIEERLVDAFREANTAVLRAADASGKAQAASTLVAAAVRGRRAVIANLGDSRAYLVHAGVARQVTQDHSGDIAHGITRFVGDPRGVQPDVFVEDLDRGDRLLLCSDGLTRHVTAEEIGRTVVGAMRISILASGTGSRPSKPPSKLESAADTLVGLANSRGGEDNITVALYVEDARSALPARRALGLGIFIALVTLVVAGSIALLASLAPYAPTAGPSASPSASASATPSASPSPSPAVTPSPSPSPTEVPTPTP